MARTARHTRSPEERRVQAEALHAGIADQVQALRSSDEWRGFLDFTRSFHHYSLNKGLLVLGQRPTASAVAGFRQWQAKGRQVRKGEKALKIFGYSTKKITEEDPTTGKEVEKCLPRFPILSVFDITQTGLTATDDLAIVATMTQYLASAGWSITSEQLGSHTNGYDTDRSEEVHGTAARVLAAVHTLAEALEAVSAPPAIAVIQP